MEQDQADSRPRSVVAPIYGAFFGLRVSPFSLRPDPDFLYWSAGHTTTFSILEYAIATLAPITVITGEVGTGKTTLLKHLIRSIPAERRVGMVADVHGERTNVLKWVLRGLHEEVSGRGSRLANANRFEAILRKEREAGRHTLLVFDEAQNLSKAMLEELRCLSNLNEIVDDGLQIILVGQPELRKTIGHEKMPQLSQRVSAQFHLSGMSKDCIAGYINHRLALAGSPREIFSQESCDLIHDASRGVPRVINHICEYALIYAYARDLRMVLPDMVRQVLSDRERVQAPA